MRRALAVCLMLCVAGLCETTAEADWGTLGAVPIQSGGRIMPLDSFARITLLQLSGRSSVKLGDTRYDALNWLLRVLFDNPAAREDRVFLIESPEITDALGLAHDKARDRYSYAFLEKGIPALMRLAGEAEAVKPAERTRFQDQVLRLGRGVRSFEQLARSFSFWRTGIAIGVETMRERLGDDATLSAYAEAFGALDPSADAELFTAVDRDINRLVKSNYSGMLTIFPKHPRERMRGSPIEEWASPWDLFLGRDPDDATLLEQFAALQTAWLAGQGPVDGDGLRAQLVQLAGDELDTGKLDMEVRYNRYDLFFWTLLAYCTGMLLCMLSWLGKPMRFALWAAVALLLVGYGLHSYGLVLRMLIRGRPPVSTLYESMLFVVWVGMTLALLTELVYRKKFALFSGAMLGTALMWVASKYATDGDTMGVLIAVLDSNFWLSIHVTSITIGYSACLLAGALGHVYIFAHLFAPERSKQLRSDLNRSIYGVIAFATIFSFGGTILGGIWADQSWGRFWGWDPKENGALLIVLWNAILLHARMGGYLGKSGLAIGSVVGNVVVVAAWWGVNLLNIGLHSYGFDNGVFTGLMAFTAFQAAVVGCGLLAARLHRRRKKGAPAQTEPASP